MTQILIIPGSLRIHSFSNIVIKVIMENIPSDVKVELFEGLKTLPHFDDPEVTPDTVIAFKNKIKESDGVMICTPEYAFGIPGSLKNALDWTVGSGEFMDKPIGLVTASSRGDKGDAAMRLVLKALSSKVIDDASLLIPFVRSKFDSSGRVIDQNLDTTLRRLLRELADASIKTISTLTN